MQNPLQAVKASPFSLIALWLSLSLSFIAGFFYYPKWNQNRTEATISWDVSGYYLYLPATFIYSDLRGVGFLDSLRQQYQFSPDNQQIFHPAQGQTVLKYPMGQAIIMFPGFAAGHLFAHLGGYPADGYSQPYQLGIGIWMWLIAAAGLFLARKVWLGFFSDRLTAFLLLLLVFGTNYLNFSAIDQAMTHATLFSGYALLLWLSNRAYREGRKSFLLLAFAVCGLMTLIRPTEVISVLIPVFWGGGVQGPLSEFASGSEIAPCCSSQA